MSQTDFPENEPATPMRRATRVAAVATLGVVSGWLSGKCYAYFGSRAGENDFGEWSPGIFYAVVWIAVLHGPFRGTSRDRLRRSVVWNLLLAAGIVASWAMAYRSAIWIAKESSGPIPEEAAIYLAGFGGGAVGCLGLVNLWAIFFRAAEPWPARILLTVLGVGLGASLGAFWVPEAHAQNLDIPFRVVDFFTVWQGGMAAALAIVDDAWRNREGVTASPR